jgi:hypothetical protein
MIGATGSAAKLCQIEGKSMVAPCLMDVNFMSVALNLTHRTVRKKVLPVF